jgi:hypothetical protein
MFTAVVVFPTPPFWLAIAMTLLMKPPKLPFKTGLLYHRRLIKERKNSFLTLEEAEEIPLNIKWISTVYV